MMSSLAYIGIGSNLGDRQANCLGAIETLDRCPQVRVTARSRLYLTEPVGYGEYKRLAAPTVNQYDGRYIVRRGAHETLEGNWHPNRLVILKFPTVTRAKEWLNSPEYAPARKLRHKYANTNMVVVEGA